MPRRPRVIVPNVPLHIIQRGNNRQACFFADEDYQFYFDWLKEYSNAAGCQIHAYVMMTNHVHLLITPKTLNSAGILMKRLGQRYVQHVNRTYRRSGTLWEGRFRSCVAQQENYLLICQRYIELNPVRAGMVKHPGEYRWSSYQANAHGGQNDVVAHHSSYVSLGRSSEDRRKRYRELFSQDLDPEVIGEIRAATNGNYALGTDRFKDEIAEKLGRRVTPGISGRPRKNTPKSE